MRKIFLTLIVLFTMVPAGDVFAEKHSSNMLGSTGVVEAIDRHGKSMIVNDSRYLVADYVVVRGRNMKSISLRSLRSGDKITFATSSSQVADIPMIIEIRVLPESYGTLE